VKKTPQGWKRSREDREEDVEAAPAVPTTPVVSRAAKRSKPVVAEESVVVEAADTAPFAFDGQEKSLCVICLSAAPSVLLIPCAHLALCEDDSKAVVQNCPVCRAKIQSTMKVYHV
jgi:hypothetical protein